MTIIITCTFLADVHSTDSLKKNKKNRLFGSYIHDTLLTISVNILCELGRLLLRLYIVAAITGATPVRI